MDKERVFLIPKDEFIKCFYSSKSKKEVMSKLDISAPSYNKYKKYYKLTTNHFDKKKRERVNFVGVKFGKIIIIGKDSASRKYEIKCDCGNIKHVKNPSVLKSCGCIGKSIDKMVKTNREREPIDASAMQVFKYRNRYNDGDLTFENFKELTQMNCHYCNTKPSNVSNAFKNDKRSNIESILNGDFIYNGLDRIDSSKKHDFDNVVPCCYYCNFAKNDLSYEEFLNNIKKILSNGSFIGKEITKIKYNNSHLLEEKKGNFESNTPKTLDIGNIFGKLKVLKINNSKSVECICECGMLRNVNKYDLLSSKSKSCNSGKCRAKYNIKASQAITQFNDRYNDGNLKFEDFFELIHMNCFYCGDLPSNKSNSKRCKNDSDRLVYSGLDRLDSNRRHDLDNVVPCCINCNQMKNTMTLQEFDKWINDVVVNLKLN